MYKLEILGQVLYFDDFYDLKKITDLFPTGTKYVIVRDNKVIVKNGTILR